MSFLADLPPVVTLVSPRRTILAVPTQWWPRSTLFSLWGLQFIYCVSLGLYDPTLLRRQCFLVLNALAPLLREMSIPKLLLNLQTVRANGRPTRCNPSLLRFALTVRAQVELLASGWAGGWGLVLIRNASESQSERQPTNYSSW